MSLYEFMSDSPWLTAWIVLCITIGFAELFYCIRDCIRGGKKK